MAKPRKPQPKYQLTLSKQKQNPFPGIEGRGIQANPNDVNELKNTPSNYEETGIPFNRSTKMSFKEDKTKQYSVGIKDIDEAIFYYFNNHIKPFVYQNGSRRDVPVMYGASERWNQYQKDGSYRDKKGAIMLPIIVIKRNSIAKDRTVANKLDANQPNLYGTWSKQFSSKNFYSNFSTLNNRKPVEKFHIVAQPDYVTLEYSCLIQTYYMEQLNKGQNRLVKGEFTLRLRGYIIPDTIQKELNATKVYNSKAKVIVTTEAVSDLEGTTHVTQNPTTDGRSRN